MLTKRLSAVVLMACLLAALAFGGVMAWAAEATGPGGANKLTVNATNSIDEEYLKDIAKANVQVDVYQVGDAVKDSTYDTYNYTLRAPYDTAKLKNLMDKALEPDGEGSWQDFSDEAFKLIDSDTPVATNVDAGVPPYTTGEEITNMADGLFLVVAHGKGIPAKDLYADSELYRYTFMPSATALPSKEPEDDGNIYSYSQKPWLNSLTIALKPGREPLYGSLIINKQILSIAGTMSNWKKSTFQYHVVSTADSPYEYDNWAAVTVDDEGGFQAPPLRYIKAGTIVTVEEVYDGADFTAVGSTKSDPVTIVADVNGNIPDNVAQVYFTNTSDTKIIQGSGIQNEFTWQDDDWQLVTTPESGQTSRP